VKLQILPRTFSEFFPSQFTITLNRPTKCPNTMTALAAAIEESPNITGSGYGAAATVRDQQV
jgi:hypothetical protein